MNRNNNHCLALFFRVCLFCLATQPVARVSASMLSPSLPQNAAAIDTQEQIWQQERERAIQQKNSPEADVRLTRPATVLPDYPDGESPCFTINTFKLAGDTASRFQWALDVVNSAKGHCFGSQGIQLAINRVQNAILERATLPRGLWPRNRTSPRAYLR